MSLCVRVGMCACVSSEWVRVSASEYAGGWAGGRGAGGGGGAGQAQRAGGVGRGGVHSKNKKPTQRCGEQSKKPLSKEQFGHSPQPITVPQ